jgi:ATP sulfurylase
MSPEEIKMSLQETAKGSYWEGYSLRDVNRTSRDIEMIEPHGGKLVNRIVSEKDKKILRERTFTLKSIRLNLRQISDLEMIATGAFSPLEGFMGREDYENVLHSMRLANGLVWSIPITLAVNIDEAKRLEEEEIPPLEFTRPEIAKVLIEGMKKKILDYNI